MNTDRTRLLVLLRTLETESVPHRVLSPDESAEATARVEALVPFTSWGRVDWANVPKQHCRTWLESPDLGSALQELLGEIPDGQQVATVIWGNGAVPCVQLPLSWLPTHAASLLEVDTDCWIVSLGKGWCIEVHHSGDVCLALR